MKQDMTVIDFLNVLKKHWILIVTLMILGMISLGAKNRYFTAPIYYSSAQVEIKDVRKHSQIDDDLKKIATYKDLVKTDDVIQNTQSYLKNDYSLNMSKKKIKSSVSTGNNQGSLIIYLTASSNNAKKATKISTSLLKAYKKDGNKTFKDTKIKTIVKPSKPTISASPSTLSGVKSGAIAGLLLGIVVAFGLGNKKIFGKF